MKPCRFCNCVPCLCFPGIRELAPILASIALELEIKNRKDELATAMLERPGDWFGGLPPPHVKKRIDENIELHERLRVELAHAIERRKPAVQR